MSASSFPVKRTIKIFCRLKPCSGAITPYDIMTVDHESGEDLLQLNVKTFPEDHQTSSNRVAQFINNKPELYSYRFSKVFDRRCKQDYVFDQVARPVIDSALEGFNGTIFAYGQTGSGKTFTMTGSREVYEHRGIIPRTLEYIFEKFQEEDDPTKIRNIFISYLEIYNEGGYDLLNASQMPGRLEDLGKVTLLEDGNKEFHLRNLSVHSIASVEEALEYLYMGDHNRTIAETPLNEASTRSHCIFTIYINIRDINSAVTNRAKLNLVDLAGSERIANSCITGQLLNEARHINLALHYLEQVIVALSDSSRVHVPYRNSMMTSILRDSLGGNCMTTMIATLSIEAKNAQETLSTCRFAQRVALVTNTVARNEDLDPTELITQLKQEVKKLKEVIASSAVKPLKDRPDPLDAEEREDCRLLVQHYLTDSDPEAILPVTPDMRLIQECFRLLKSSVNSPTDYAKRNRNKNIHSQCLVNDGIGMDEGTRGTANSINDDLEETLARRNTEIKILMEMLKKEKSKSRCQTSVSFISTDIENSNPDFDSENDNDEGVGRKNEDWVTTATAGDSQPRIPSSTDIKRFTYAPGMLPETRQSFLHANTPPPTPVVLDEQSKLKVFEDPKKAAFTKFLMNYPGKSSLDTLIAKTNKKKEEIKELESTINSNRSNIESLKYIIEGNAETNGMSISSLKEALTAKTKAVLVQEQKLREGFEEVANLQSLLTSQYKKLQGEFENWLAENGDGKIVFSDEFKSAALGACKKLEHGPDLVEMPSSVSSIHELGPISRTEEKSQHYSGTALYNQSINTSARSNQIQGKMQGNPMASTEYAVETVQEYNAPPNTATTIIPNYSSEPLTYSIDSNTSLGSRQSQMEKQVPLTGDPDTDAEVMKFLRSREHIFKTMQAKSDQNANTFQY